MGGGARVGMGWSRISGLTGGQGTPIVGVGVAKGSGVVVGAGVVVGLGPAGGCEVLAEGELVTLGSCAQASRAAS